jgi:hypothetical protein
MMTENQFFRSKWKPFEVMTVFVKELNRFCECFLIGVEFEDKIMKLRPLDPDVWEDEIYEVSIDTITRGKAPALEIVK